MTTTHTLSGILLAGALALAHPQSAHAGLHVDLVFIDSAPPPPPSLLVGGGNLPAIMQAAANAWEQVFKRGGGNWRVTIEYGWAPLGGQYGREIFLAQGGNPVRITRAQVLFDNAPQAPTGGGVAGFFADPTPDDHSEYLRYTSDRANVGNGQLNIGRVFSNAAGDAAERIDLLTLAMHEIGHALGLDYSYAGFSSNFSRGSSSRSPRHDHWRDFRSSSTMARISTGSVRRR